MWSRHRRRLSPHVRPGSPGSSNGRQRPIGASGREGVAQVAAAKWLFMHSGGG